MTISLDNPRPISKLDAVNIILRSRGQGSAASLGAQARPAVKEAEEVLAATNLEIQGGDYNFNKERRLKLTPSAQKEIILPSGLLSFQVTYTSRYLNVTERDGKLYNLDESSYKFNTEVYIEATLGIPFEDLPQPVRWYVAILSSFQYANQVVPGDASLRPTEIQLARAKANFEQFDSKLTFNNNLRANPHFRRMRGNR